MNKVGLGAIFRGVTAAVGATWGGALADPTPTGSHYDSEGVIVSLRPRSCNAVILLRLSQWRRGRAAFTDFPILSDGSARRGGCGCAPLFPD